MLVQHLLTHKVFTNHNQQQNSIIIHSCVTYRRLQNVCKKGPSSRMLVWLQHEKDNPTTYLPYTSFSYSSLTTNLTYTVAT